MLWSLYFAALDGHFGGVSTPATRQLLYAALNQVRQQIVNIWRNIRKGLFYKDKKMTNDEWHWFQRIDEVTLTNPAVTEKFKIPIWLADYVIDHVNNYLMEPYKRTQKDSKSTPPVTCTKK